MVLPCNEHVALQGWRTEQIDGGIALQNWFDEHDHEKRDTD